MVTFVGSSVRRVALAYMVLHSSTCVRGAQGVCSSEIAMSRITSIKRICNMLHVFIVRMYRGYQFLLITSQ